MIDKGKASVIGVDISMIDYDAAVSGILEAAKNKRSLKVTALAVHGVMTGFLDREQRFRLNAFDLVCPDGQPVRWALNLLHRAGLKERVYGPDLMLKTCADAARDGIPIYLYGSREIVLEKLAENLKRRVSNLEISGTRPSLFRKSTYSERNEIAAEIRESGAGIVFVGLGCPRQETWVYEYAGLLNMPAIAVGAAFDFHAGLLPQAPSYLQRWGLEWLFRLVQEPARLWRRYVLLNPLFVAMAFLQWTGLRRFQDRGVEPETQENFA